MWENVVFTWNKDVLASNFEMKIWEILDRFIFANRHNVVIACHILVHLLINEINERISLIGWEQ
jgi:hypothetical protein